MSSNLNKKDLRVHASELEGGDEDALLLHGKPFTGTAYEQYANGQLREEVSYVEGYSNGPCKSWYENGQLKEEYVALPGRAPDKSMGWHDNGALRHCTERELGVRVAHKEWDSDGRLVVNEKLEPGTFWHSHLLKLRETGAPWK